MRYTVVVGNVGKVYDGKSKKEAKGVFEDYKQISKSGVGRAGGKYVNLLEDGELLESFVSVRKKPKAGKLPIARNPAEDKPAKSSSSTAYCMKCKSSVTIKLPKSETLSNGVHAVRGSCPDCGTKVFRLLGK